MFDLRERPGVRIGVVISDDRTMVYAPVSRNVEAGSTSEEKPNAIMLEGRSTERLAQAAGAAEGETEVGLIGMAPERVDQMEADLKANPPRPFDLTRRLMVFVTEVQFIELQGWRHSRSPISGRNPRPQPYSLRRWLRTPTRELLFLWIVGLMCGGVLFLSLKGGS